MKRIDLNRDWEFGHGMLQHWIARDDDPDGKRIVQLPHDYMIGSDVRKDAPSGTASGFYNAGVAYYNKTVEIPEEWRGERVYLYFDGAMMNATVEINGAKAALHFSMELCYNRFRTKPSWKYQRRSLCIDFLLFGWMIPAPSCRRRKPSTPCGCSGCARVTFARR